MREELKKVCDLFIANKKELKEDFPFSSASAAGSILLTGSEQKPNRDKIKEINQVLKDKEGVFSALRAHLKVPVICMMAVSEDPALFVDRMRSTFNKLNQNRILENEYDIVSAMILNQKADDSKIDEYVKKTCEIYELMKQNHGVLTGGEDMPFAAIIASTDKEPKAILEDAEKCFKLLRERFPVSGAVQPLAHILSINPATPEEKVKKAIDLYEAFKQEGIKYGKSYELPGLGSLVTLDMTPEEIVKETKEAFDYINDNHGYGFLETSKEEKVLIASLMVLMSHKTANFEEMETAAISAELSIILAIELMVIMVSISIATSSASNN